MAWASFRPGTKPLAALASALRPLKLPATGLFALAAPYQITQPIIPAPTNQISLLLIDQFEEFFSQSDTGERSPFFTLLTNLPPFPELRMHIIATLRADYLPDLFTHPALYDAAKAGLDLRVMDADQLELAIQRPLQVLHPLTGKRFQATILNRLAADATEDAAYLPLLQVTLEELWRGGLLTIDNYKNLSDALSKRADTIFTYTSDAVGNPSQRLPQQQEALLQVFLDLVDVSPDGDQRRDVRRTQRLSDLTRGQSAIESLIRELTTARLLSMGEKSLAEGEQPTQTVDIIHESLIQNWARLRQAIQTKREHLQQRRRFELRLAEWCSHAESTAFLLTGVYLAEAEQLQQSADVALQSPVAKAYLAQSINQRNSLQQAEIERQRLLTMEQAKRTQTFRLAAIITSVLFIIAVIIGFIAYDRQRAAVTSEATAQAQSRRADNARATADIDAAIAITRSLEAQAARATAQTEAINAQAQSQIAMTRAAEAQTAKATAEANRAAALNQARLAKVGELAAAASRQVTQVDFNPSLTLLLAMRALTMTQPTDGPVFVNAIRTLDEVVRQTQMWRMTLQGHSDNVNSAVFSPDGQRILTASRDHTACIWNADTGQTLFTLQGHTDYVSSAVFSPDGQRILTASDDKTARIWNATTGQELYVLRHNNKVTSAVFSPDGRHIFTASDDGTLWDSETGKTLFTVRSDANVTPATFSPGGQRIVTATGAYRATVWDAATGEEVLNLQGHADRVTLAAFSPNGQLILTASEDKTARIWNATTGQELHNLEGHTDHFTSAVFSPNSQLVATASWDHTARIWDIATGEELYNLQDSREVNAALFSPDGQHIITSSDDGNARVWDTATGQVLSILHGHLGEVSSAIFSPDGQRIVTASWGDHTARLWDAFAGQGLHIFQGHTRTVSSAVFRSDGQHILTASYDSTARIWNAATGQALSIRLVHPFDVVSAVFSPDGKRIATAGWGDNTARVWDATSSKILSTLYITSNTTTDNFNSAVFSLDSKHILTSNNDHTARVWDAATSQTLLIFQGHDDYVTSAVYSPDDRRILTASWDRTARIWDANTAQVFLVLHGHTDHVNSAVFSSDGKRILTASDDKTARIWDSTTGQALFTLQGHTGQVMSAAFSPDGKQIVTASRDQTARIWDTATGRVLVIFQGHTNDVLSAVFSPDGQRILTASDDYTARTWFSSLNEYLVVARRLIQRNPPVFTREEQVQYGLEQ